MHGQVSFDRSANTLTITQGSDKAIIHWDDFSIAKGNLTQFLQPGSHSAALNRVIGDLRSEIHGDLTANGRIFLINPNGVLIGPTGRIDVGGFLASTLDVSDADFLAGGDMLFKGDSQAKVVNLGTINAIDGDIFLIAREVENHGTLTAQRGTVGLAAGQEVLIKAEGAERVFVRPTGSGKSETGVTNTGVIEAATAELKAHGNLYALAINNTGVVRAHRGGGTRWPNLFERSGRTD